LRKKTDRAMIPMYPDTRNRTVLMPIKLKAQK
jgi:hypothetical protein